MKNSQVYDWHKRFSDGCESFDNDPRSGRPSTSTNKANVDRVREILRGDKRRGVGQTLAEVQISVRVAKAFFMMC
jgi:transposase